MLEASQHQDNSFVTLTYDPELYNGASLEPRHTELFLKRFRKQIEPKKIRFYLVGEYGERNNRPHYHLALFGYPMCVRGDTRYCGKSFNCCSACRNIHFAWGYGRVSNLNLEKNSAQYIAGYVTKKMTRRDDPRLNLREPEFSRMSRMPALGTNAMHDVADTILTLDLHKTQSDVPVTLRHGPQEFPLGRTLRKKLRTFIGRDEKAPHQENPLLEMPEIKEVLESKLSQDAKNNFVKNFLLDAGEQKARNQLARAQIYKKKDGLK